MFFFSGERKELVFFFFRIEGLIFFADRGDCRNIWFSLAFSPEAPRRSRLPNGRGNAVSLLENRPFQKRRASHFELVSRCRGKAVERCGPPRHSLRTAFRAVVHASLETSIRSDRVCVLTWTCRRTIVEFRGFAERGGERERERERERESPFFKLGFQN